MRHEGQRVLQPEVQALPRQRVHSMRRVAHKHHGAVLHATGLHQLQRDSNGFANNVMQAVSTSAGSGDYSPRLRVLFQTRVAQWIQSCLQISASEAASIAAVVLMAFDGFAMNVHLAHGVACDKTIVELFAGLLARASSGDTAT